MFTGSIDARSRKAAPETSARSGDMVALARENGLALVPIKPTSEMLIAGVQAGDSDVSEVWKIYQAMIGKAG